MKGRWESNINVWFPLMYSQKWNCAASLLPKQNHNILSPQPIPIHSYICERFIYFQDRSVYFPAANYVDWSWEYINRSHTHECGNWDWGRANPRKGINKWDFRCSVVKTLPKKDHTVKSTAAWCLYVTINSIQHILQYTACVHTVQYNSNIFMLINSWKL